VIFFFDLEVSFFTGFFRSWCKNIEILCFQRRWVECLFYNTSTTWQCEHVFSLDVELCTFSVNLINKLYRDQYQQVATKVPRMIYKIHEV
jgi:hypothetical protein